VLKFRDLLKSLLSRRPHHRKKIKKKIVMRKKKIRDLAIIGKKHREEVQAESEQETKGGAV